MKMPSGEYGRCRKHGGRAALANWKHGKYSAAMVSEGRQVTELLGETTALFNRIAKLADLASASSPP